MNETQLATLEKAFSQDDIDVVAVESVFIEQMDEGNLSPMLMTVANAFFWDPGQFFAEIHRVRAGMRTIPWKWAEDSRIWLDNNDKEETE